MTEIIDFLTQDSMKLILLAGVIPFTIISIYFKISMNKIKMTDTAFSEISSILISRIHTEKINHSGIYHVAGVFKHGLYRITASCGQSKDIIIDITNARHILEMANDENFENMVICTVKQDIAVMQLRYFITVELNKLAPEDKLLLNTKSTKIDIIDKRIYVSLTDTEIREINSQVIYPIIKRLKNILCDRIGEPELIENIHSEYISVASESAIDIIKSSLK